MLWLALSIALIVAVAIGATLLRHPGVVLYDWIATRQAAARARPATRAPQTQTQTQPRPAKHAEPAALAG